MFIQSQVNYIAKLVESVVILEDTNAKVICFSPHYNDLDIDEVRVYTVLQQKVPQNVVDYFRLKGIYEKLRQKVGILETPAFPDINIGPRVAFPIHWEKELVATLWFSNTSVGFVRKFEEEIAKTAEDIGRMLWLSSTTESMLIVKLLGYLKSINPGFLKEGFLVDAVRRMGFDIKGPYCFGVLKIVGECRSKSIFEKKMILHSAIHKTMVIENFTSLSGWNEEEYLILTGGKVLEKSTRLVFKEKMEEIAADLREKGLHFRAGISGVAHDVAELPDCYE